ncbi:hypothetical protein Tco_1516519 [Tanacetum coccineum]
MQAALHLLRYLKGTISKGLFNPVQPHLQMTSFSDAEWASCLMTRRSLTGYCIFLGHSLVSWKIKKQPTVTRSSTEAEYRNMTATTCELLWLSFLLKDLHIQVKLPVTRQNSRSFLKTAFIPTHLQLADVMTTALGELQHTFLVDKLGLTEAPT